MVSYNTRSSAERGYAFLSAWLTLKMGGNVRKPNQLHIQGPNGGPWDINEFSSWKLGLLTKIVSYRTPSLAKHIEFTLRDTFDLEYGSAWPWNKTGCIGKVLMDVHEKCLHFWSHKSRSPTKMVSNSKWLAAKWKVCALWVSFDIKYCPAWSWGETWCIAKV